MKPSEKTEFDPRDVWVVVAAFDEAPRIGNVVRELRRGGWNVLVVDDGSSDDTDHRALCAGAIVIRHLINRGQGAALQTGIDFALRRGCRALVTFDGDGQHDPRDVSGLLEPIADGQAEIVLGSRFLGNRPQGMPWLRRVLLRLAVGFTRISTGLSITDTHNGIRALTAEAAQRIEIREDRMAHASDILHQIAAEHLRYVERPVAVRYTVDTLAKGQQNSAAIGILTRLLLLRILQ